MQQNNHLCGYVAFSVGKKCKMSLCHGERVDITIKTAQQNRIYAVMNPFLLQLIMDIFP